MTQARGEMAGRGHRRMPHTADVILEAWGPDRASCLEEAVAALTGTYVEFDPAGLSTAPPMRLTPGPVEDQLLALLDEVVFALDTAEGVPVVARVQPLDDGSLEATLELASRDRVVCTGAVPKAIARSELVVTEVPHRVSCRFLVDV